MFIRGQTKILQRTRCLLCDFDLKTKRVSTTSNTTIRRPPPPLRRKRPKHVPTFIKNYVEESNEFIRQTLSGGQTEPIPQSESSLEEYQKKASLSPWVPAPESVIRRMLDMSKANSNDIHIDLGCGDGRLNFQAIDRPYGVHQSIGIDVDEILIGKAQERLTKRHPQPNVQFYLADLTDSGHDIWRKVIPEATIITMFFVEKALGKLRPLLEHSLQGRACNIVTCGYAMPGWNPSNVDRILDLTIHLYEWKGSSEDMQLTGIDLVDDELLYDNELNQQSRKGEEQQASNQRRTTATHFTDDIVMPLTPLIPHADLIDNGEESDDEDKDGSDEDYLEGRDLDGVVLANSFDTGREWQDSNTSK